MAGTITHEWNGTVLTITSDSGTSSMDLKGDTGIRGPQGPAGTSLDGGTGITATTLWEGSANITSNSAASSALPYFNVDSYDYYDVTIEYAGYDLDKTNVRCYPCKTFTQGSAISGHLTWFATYWLSLDMMIYSNGTARLGCLFRDAQSASYTLGSNTFTVTKLIGYKAG